MKIRTGLTYDDVLLVPKRSPVRSRKEINTETKLTRNINLNIPIISANMDTVTESTMAISLATLGGIGFIHRFMSISDQAKEAVRVKRHEHYIIEDPIYVSEKTNLEEAREVMKEHNITSVFITEGQNRLLGLLTARDIMFETNGSKSITLLMTPVSKLTTASCNITFEKAKKLLHKHKIEKLPLIDKKGRICGLITARDILHSIEHPQATKDKKGRLMVGAAVGVRQDALVRAKQLVNAGCDVLLIDIAHGHADQTIDTLKRLKKGFPKIPIVVGNVATTQGTDDLIKNGADAVKVGIGPGSMCTTRVVAGAGVPQLTAIIDCSKVAQKKKVSIIADGGIRVAGDVAKAIAAGASSVMIGGLFAGTSQSSGITVIRQGKKYKISRGLASVGVNINRKSAKELEDYVAEGVEAFVPFRGDVGEIVSQLVGGLRSGMSYTGAETIAQFHKKAEFIRITPSGLKESLSHDVEVM